MANQFAKIYLQAVTKILYYWIKKKIRKRHKKLDSTLEALKIIGKLILLILYYIV